jgi:hypothetical protein
LKYEEQPPPDGAQNWQFIAGVYARLGEKDRAFQWLDQGFQNRDFFMTFAQTDPAMDSTAFRPAFCGLAQEDQIPTRVRWVSNFKTD